MRVLAFASLVAASVLSAGPASAHIQLVSPVQRHAEQKVGPCGVGAVDMRGPNVTTYAPGEKIVVSWMETVNHPGHFRISFDADGFDDFGDPASYDELYSNPAVLVDGIADVEGGMVEQEVTLPNIECENCTLQVIQVMTDKPPYEIGTNDLYYQCADIRLVGDVMGMTTGEPGTTGGSDSSAGETSAGETGVDPSAGETSGSESAASGSTGGAPDTGGEQPTTGAADATATDDAITTTTATTAATSPADPDDDKGCGCRGDDGRSGLLALIIIPFARRRRRA